MPYNITKYAGFSGSSSSETIDLSAELSGDLGQPVVSIAGNVYVYQTQDIYFPATSIPRDEQGSTPSSIGADLQKEFALLVRQWEKDTGFHSSLGIKFTHPAYQRIIGMGTPALQLILSELKRKPGHWFYALSNIAGRDYAADAGAKTFAEAREAWLNWGHNNGLI